MNMKKSLVLLASSALILMAAPISGATGLLEVQRVDTAVPTGGLLGSAVGCEISGGLTLGYGEPGVPQSDGFGDGICDDSTPINTGDIAYTVVKLQGDGSSNSFSSAYGFDENFDYFEYRITCDHDVTAAGVELLVDWTTGVELYLSGGPCEVLTFGTLSPADVNWYAFGWVISGGDLKFVYTDNLVDALAELLL